MKFQSSMIIYRSVNTISVQAVVFWIVTPCSQARRYLCSSKILVLTYKTAWCHNKKDTTFPETAHHSKMTDSGQLMIEYIATQSITM
jgi:hypothetical protein